MTWFRKPKLSPAEVARQLREQALAALAASNAASIGGALFEIGFPNGTATVMCLADGTTSLYFSTGGGVIGAGTHAPVRRAAAAFIADAARLAANWGAASETSLARQGEVRFYVATASGLRTAGGVEAVLAAGGDPLSGLYAAGQAVITAIRESTPPQ